MDDRWRIDVDGVLALFRNAGIELHETQEYAFRAFWSEPEQHMIIRSGRRWGKTFFGAAVLLAHVLTDEKPVVWVVAPERWQTAKLMSYAKQFCDKLGISSRVDDSEDVRLHVGERVVLGKVSTNKKGLAGEGLTLVIEDEAELSSPTHYDIYIRPMLLDYGGRALFLSSKYGATWLREMAERGEARLLEYPNWANPHISWKRVIEDRQRMPLNVWRAMYAAEEAVLEGALFTQLPTIKQISETGATTKCIGVDWGYFRPFAAVLVLRFPDGTVYAAREAYGRGVCIREQVSMIKRMASHHYSDAVVVADPSCFVRSGDVSVAAQWAEHGLHAIRGTRDLQGSLQLLLDLSQDGKLVVSPECPQLLKEIRNARVDVERSRDVIVGDDHALDALRYAVSHVEQAAASGPSYVVPGSLEWLEAVIEVQRRRRYVEERGF